MSQRQVHILYEHVLVFFVGKVSKFMSDAQAYEVGEILVQVNVRSSIRVL
jgi:hypothetical protein